MSETKVEQLIDMKSSSSVHTWCTKEQADFIAAKLSSLALIEAERDKLLAVNKVLERSHKLMLALVLDDESKATKEQLAESVDICKALKLAGESV
jgi:hypothetical protein